MEKDRILLKTFTGYVTTTEGKFDVWSQENPNIEIIAMNTAMGDKYDSYVLTILYRELGTSTSGR